MAGLLNLTAQEQARIAISVTILYFDHTSQEEVVLIIYWLAHIRQVLMGRVKLFIRAISVFQFKQSSPTLGTTNKPEALPLQPHFCALKL